MKVFRIALWAAFAGLVVAICATLLRACGLLTFLAFVTPQLGWNFCRPPLALTIRLENALLIQRVQELEIEKAHRQLACLKTTERQPDPFDDGPATRLASSRGR